MIGPTARTGAGSPRAGGPARERPEAGRELLVGERLDEIVVGAGVEAGDPVADRVAGGEHEDREVRLRPADSSRDVEAGHVGQADVEDHDVDPGRVLGDRGAGLAVVGDVDDVTILLEQALEDTGESFVVLDDEEMHDDVLSRGRP